MTVPKWPIFVCLPMFLFSCAVAHGQGQQTSGMFGSRTLGGSMSARQGSTFGTPGNRIEQAQSGAGEIQGNERFVRGNRQPGQFVGSDSGDMNNFFSALTGRGTGAGQGLRGGNQNRGNSVNSSRGNSRQFGYRTTLRVGFEYTPVPHHIVTATVEQRLAKIPQVRSLSPISVTMDGRTAVLTGSVVAERDRDLAAQMVLLEPGVSEIRNELTVGLPEIVLPPPPNIEDATQEKAPELPDVPKSSP